MSQSSSADKKNPMRWLLPGGILLALLCLCTLATGALGFGALHYFRTEEAKLPPEQPRIDQPHGDVLVLIAANDGLSAYITNLDTQSISLPSGAYYAEVFSAEGGLWAFSPLTVMDQGGGLGYVDFSQQSGYPLTEGGDDVTTLVQFLLSVEHIHLTYFEIITNNFQTPMFDHSVREGWEEESRLMDAFNALGDQQLIADAADAFMLRAGQSYLSVPHTGVLGRPYSNPLSKIAAFFGIISEENAQAREDILSVYPHMSEWEKEEAYQALSPGLQSYIADFDDFIQRVERKEIGGLSTVRRDLFTVGPYAGLWQTFNPDSNRPSGEIIHRVGSEAVHRGAHLNFAVSKGALSVQFAGIEAGFDFVDKTSAWVNYIEAFYQDPGSALVGEIRNQIESQISDDIKSALLDRFPDMGETLAEELAGRIKDRMVSQIMAVSAGDQPDVSATTTSPADEEGSISGIPEDPETGPPEEMVDDELVIEARYVGTFTDTQLFDGCMVSGDFELLLYTNNKASIGRRYTEDSCNELTNTAWFYTDPNQGTHAIGIFSITFRNDITLSGQYDEIGMSGSMEDAFFLFLCSGEWVP